MIPEKRLSNTPVIGRYVGADERLGRRIGDFENGGVALNDPTQGFNVNVWELYLQGNEARVRTVPNGAPTVLFSDTDITRLKLAFDQNMRPAVAYVADGVAKLWWYDSTIPGNRTTTIQGATEPVLCLDDKRDGQRDFSDILLFYLKDGEDEAARHLYMRAQRDRYTIEYDIGLLPAGARNILQVGMADNLRLLFELLGKFAEPQTGPRPPTPLPPGSQPSLILKLDEVGYAAPESGAAVMQFDWNYFYPPDSD